LDHVVLLDYEDGLGSLLDLRNVHDQLVLDPAALAFQLSLQLAQQSTLALDQVADTKDSAQDQAA
jgi:hypothetical protein